MAPRRRSVRQRNGPDPIRMSELLRYRNVSRSSKPCLLQIQFQSHLRPRVRDGSPSVRYLRNLLKHQPAAVVYSISSTSFVSPSVFSTHHTRIDGRGGKTDHTHSDRCTVSSQRPTRAHSWTQSVDNRNPEQSQQSVSTPSKWSSPKASSRRSIDISRSTRTMSPYARPNHIASEAERGLHQEADQTRTAQHSISECLRYRLWQERVTPGARTMRRRRV